jgi:hypothetical protein
MPLRVVIVCVAAWLLPATAAIGAVPSLSHCANGALAAPMSCSSQISWPEANLNASKAHYREDEVVPFRLVITGLDAGAHTTTLEWDTLKNGKRAYDFLYSFDYTEPTADPCAEVAGCSPGVASYAAIPLDPNVPAAYQTTGMPSSGGAHDGQIVMFGGAIANVTVPSHPGGTDDPARLTISFTMASAGTAVLAWGAHIADHHDWGAGSAAANVLGSPYHLRLVELDGSGANPDRSISSDAVYFPSTITVVKDVVPDAPQDFSYSTTGGLAPAAFSLDDDGVSANPLSSARTWPPLVSASKETYTVTEASVPRWALDSTICTTTSAGGVAVDDQTVDVPARTVTIPLDEGEEIICTFSSTAPPPKLSVVNDVVNDDGGSSGPFPIQVTANSPSPASFTGAAAPGTEVDVGLGDYGVTAVAPFGYSVAYSAGCQGTIEPGEHELCVVTHDDVTPAVIVMNSVVNDSGGSRQASNFTMLVTGTNPSPSDFPGDPGGTVVHLDAGPYQVAEAGSDGYAVSYSADCAGTVAVGDVKTCTVTNDDIAPPPIAAGPAAVSGAAALTAPRRCVRRVFRIRVSGRQIARILVRVDGRLRTFRTTVRGPTQFVFTVNPRRYAFGRHRMTVQVTFFAASGTKPVVRRTTFRRCRPAP